MTLTTISTRIGDGTDEPVTQPLTSPMFLSDVLALAAELATMPGTDLAADLERIEARAAAISAGVDYSLTRQLEGDLLSLTPEELRLRVQSASHDRAAAQCLTQQGVLVPFEAKLQAEATALLTKHADAVVVAQRKAFAKQIKVIEKAHAAGLSNATDPATLLESGTPEQIAAYRDLPVANAELNAIAALRHRLTEVLGYGPAKPPVAAFVTGIPDNLEMQSAWNAWVGSTEVVQVQLPFAGSHLQTVKRKRLGGPWLALVGQGRTMRLNTASETEAVIAAARAGSAA